jgi:hypothetical protein
VAECEKALFALFKTQPRDVTEENIQARRGCAAVSHWR